jgi:CRISPR-associated protein Csx3
MSQFPAIAIGGPPHSGKSVLTYSLTQILRAQQVEHYVLRACPDGEGDWSQEAPPESVRLLRNKGQFTETFVAYVGRSLQQRHLPLLVDMGGRPTREQEVLFDYCTHALLLAPNEAELSQWRELAQRHKLPLLAELQSTLTEPEAIYTEYPILHGRIAGLERQQPPQSALVERLAWNIRTLFAQSQTEIRSAHLQAAPAEITVELDRLAHTLGIAANGVWRPTELTVILNYLPAGVPLAIYGRGPNWLYGALAAHAYPATFYQFDARLGWVTPAHLQITTVSAPAPVQIQLVERANHCLLQARILDTYLDYSEANSLPTPPVLTNCGIIIHGKLPHWLVTGFVLAYHAAPWLAIYQPQLQGAVVVASRLADYPIGRCLAEVQLSLS